MARIVECVPNFSEGRAIKVINAIAGAISGVAGVKLLSAEPDKDYNRTVVTFVGEPAAVVEAAFMGTRKAAELIDMTAHKGEHPRIGATDVVPFVPVAGVTIDDCVALAREFGKRAGEELGIPIYLYEAAATRPERRNLSTIRKGEYEGLAEKLKDPEWAPDFGPTVFNPRSGATVTGARMFLIAYNVNLATPDVAVANEIALRIRESGRVKKDAEGKPVIDAQGKKITIPGTLKAVKAMGVLLEAHTIAQVSINLVNFHVTPPHVAFEEVKRQAASLGVAVTGSEIVGLTPREALQMAGTFYAPDAPSDDLRLEAAVASLGLSQLEPFDPAKKIIEANLSQ
jgi:glutamate formiminotransferase/formiminotetrahydrofolate cyclodeaminase